MAVRLITAGACDLTTEYLKLHNVDRVPFYVSFDGENYLKEVEELDVRDFYQQMIDHKDVFPRTSLPSMNDYIDMITPMIEAGDDVVVLCFTSCLSGAYNATLNVHMMLEEDYPDLKVYMVDTLCATVSQASIVGEAIRMRDAGMSAKEIVDKLEAMKEACKIFFTVGNLDYLIHGGRIGKMAGRVSNTLNLKPMIVLVNGECTTGGVVRSRKKSMKKAIDLMKDHINKNNLNVDDFVLNVGYGYDVAEGQKFADMVKKEAQALGYTGDVPTIQIGATIAVHTGPEALGIGFVPKYETI
ncbi:MAG: DegV family protein [Lachnospiraceae bacterium]|nr:DegV family protein [Lachnospiraceae bacterium]